MTTPDQDGNRVDVAALDTETIRTLIQQGRQVLRNRGLIPDATLWKATTPALTDTERATIRRAARKLKVPAVTLAEEILALRTTPQLVTLHARDGHQVQLAPLVRVDCTGFSGVAVTGNGQICLDLATPSRYTHTQAAVSEYVILQSDGRPRVSESGYTRHGRYAFDPLLGAAFVHAWTQLRCTPTHTALRIILAMAGHQDTPQEALLTWCVGVVAQRLGEMGTEGTLVSALLGCPMPPLTVADLIRPALTQVNHGASPRSLLGHRYHRDGGYQPSSAHDWHHKLVRAIDLFLVGTNLIAPDLANDPVLDLSLREIWERYLQQERVASVRAGRLRAAVVQRFGFQEIQWSGEKAWIRTDPPMPPDCPSYQLSEVVRKQPHVLITASCRIYVNGVYRCVVEGRSADLPQADQVVRRLLAVATTHRERIHTLATDMPVLETLFRRYRDARLWDLLSEIPEAVPTYH